MRKDDAAHQVIVKKAHYSHCTTLQTFLATHQVIGGEHLFEDLWQQTLRLHDWIVVSQVEE